MVLESIKSSPVLMLWLIAVFLFSSIVVNGIEIALFLFIWPLSKRMFRILLAKALYVNYCVMTALGSWWADVNIHCYGDAEHYAKLGKEHAILIGNHRGDMDWLVGWRIAEYKNILSGCKCFVKGIVKFIPTIGWSWWFAEFGFLKRNWDADKKEIERVLKALSDYPVPFWIGIYPEGTRMTPDKLKASQEYAVSKGIEPLKHHLLPRPKGFVTTVNALKGIAPAVYIFTTMVENEESATFMYLLKGKTVKAHVHMKRCPLDEVPTGSYEETAEWCKQQFREMDNLVEYYVNNNKRFPGESFKLPRKLRSFLVTIFWAVATTTVLIYGVYYIITAGSWMLYGAAVCFIAVGLFLFKSVVSLADTKKGSSYGLSNSPSHVPTQDIKKKVPPS